MIHIHLRSGQPLSRQQQPQDNPHNSQQSKSAAGIESLSQSSSFQSQFTGRMELHGDSQQVAQYLDAHQGWFCRCAQPMKVEPLGENGYALSVGRYGSLGYELEPRIGLILLPGEQGVYRIQTISVPGCEAQNYQVDFQAALQLVDSTTCDLLTPSTPPELTCVEWYLNLGVTIQFPRFIYKLPQRLIQQTGDRLLLQIVRQVSQRLTTRVQDDFHANLGKQPFPQPR